MRRLSNYHCRKIVRRMLKQWLAGDLNVIDKNGDVPEGTCGEIWEIRDQYYGMHEVVSCLPDGDRKFIRELLELLQTKHVVPLETLEEA